MPNKNKILAKLKRKIIAFAECLSKLPAAERDMDLDECSSANEHRKALLKGELAAERLRRAMYRPLNHS